MNQSYNVIEINDFDSFMTLRDKWNLLAGGQLNEKPFLCHEWFELWLNNFLKQDQLFILVLVAADEIVAIAPLYLSSSNFKSIPVRRLGLLVNAYSPGGNLICGNAGWGSRASYLKLFVDYVMTKCDQWDIFDFGPLPEEIIRHYDVESYASLRGLRNVKITCQENWFWEGGISSSKEYLSSRSKNFLKELKKRKRRLEDEGSIEITINTPNEDLDELIDDYYNVYEKSWKQKEHIGPNFHRDFARLASSKGWLRLGFVRVNGVAKATSYALVSGSVGYLLKSAYDLEMRQYGLGNMLRLEMISALIDKDHVSFIDLGTGDESYKVMFASSKRHLQSIIIFGKGIKGFLLHQLCSKGLPYASRHHFLESIKRYISLKLKS